MEQVPAVSSVTDVPATVQTASEFDANATVRPDEAVAPIGDRRVGQGLGSPARRT